MPDGDIVHNKLPWLYQKPYKVLCDGKDSRDECVWALMGAMIRDIKNRGAAPVILAKRMGECLREAINKFYEDGSRSWAAVSEELNQLARQDSCRYYEKQLVLRACQSVLHDVRYGRRIDARSLSEVAVERYFQELYRANFEERIPLPLAFKHHAGVGNATVIEMVKALRPSLLPMFCKWAKQANADEDVKNLRRPRRQKVKEIDMHGEDLK